jgi:hypothetical protein
MQSGQFLRSNAFVQDRFDKPVVEMRDALSYAEPRAGACLRASFARSCWSLELAEKIK